MHGNDNDYDQPQDPELLLYSLNFYRPQIEAALQITAEYVSTNKLILTGGTAIDMALRTIGQNIYDDDSMPDYDIISSENLKHATALAEILCKEGFKDINVISAVHITTMRVRIRNVPLLDASYLPESVMEQIPFVDVGMFRIVHPEYQKIDQRLSLGQLMNDTGISLNIFNRLEKDFTRNILLKEHFSTKDISELNISPNEKKKILADTHTVQVPLKPLIVDHSKLRQISDECFIYEGDFCISGLLAYAIYYDYFCKSNSPIQGTIEPFVKINKDSISMQMPNDWHVELLSCTSTPESVLKKLTNCSSKDLHYFNQLTNTKPPVVQCVSNKVTYQVADTYGLRIGINIIDELPVCSIDYLLMQLLRDRIFARDPLHKKMNDMYYNSLIAMVEQQQEDVEIDPIWGPVINTYGYTLIPEHKAFAILKLLNKEASLSMKPKNSYLRVPQCLTKSDFDSQGSPFFIIDGKQNDKLEHTNHKWIMDMLYSIKELPSTS